MNIEEKNNEECMDEFLITDLINIIYKSYKHYLIHQLSELDVTPGQIPFILELMRSKATYQSDLTEKLLLSRAVTAKTLKKLDDKHITERRIAGDNRRKKEVRLTEKGEDIASKIENIEKNWDYEILKNLDESFSDEDKAKIKELLKTLAKSSLDASMKDGRGMDNFKDIENCHKGHPFRGPPHQMGFFGKRDDVRKKRFKKH